MFKKLIFCLISAILLVSCGGTTVKVRQSSDGVNATVSVTTNNPTNVEVAPSISIDIGELNEVLDSLKNLSSEPVSFEFDENGEMQINFDSLCKSIDPQMLTQLLSSYVSPFIRSYFSLQSPLLRHTRSSIEKMRSINCNSCRNLDVMSSYGLRM